MGRLAALLPAAVVGRISPVPVSCHPHGEAAGGSRPTQQEDTMSELSPTGRQRPGLAAGARSRQSRSPLLRPCRPAGSPGRRPRPGRRPPGRHGQRPGAGDSGCSAPRGLLEPARKRLRTKVPRHHLGASSSWPCWARTPPTRGCALAATTCWCTARRRPAGSGTAQGERPTSSSTAWRATCAPPCWTWAGWATPGWSRRWKAWPAASPARASRQRRTARRRCATIAAATADRVFCAAPTTTCPAPGAP